MITIFTFLFSLVIFFKSWAYGTYELKNNKNKLGGFCIFFISIIALILPTIMVYIS